jgi:hypothetical protein
MDMVNYGCFDLIMATTSMTLTLCIPHVHSKELGNFHTNCDVEINSNPYHKKFNFMSFFPMRNKFIIKTWKETCVFFQQNLRIYNDHKVEVLKLG